VTYSGSYAVGFRGRKDWQLTLDWPLVYYHAGSASTTASATGMGDLELTLTHAFETSRKVRWSLGMKTRLREVTGQTIIPQEKSMLRMLRHVKRGGAVAFLADLTVALDQASVVNSAFALEMCVSTLNGIFALRGSALMVPILCIPQADGGVLVQACEPLDIPADATLATIAQLCWNFFEPTIRAQPGLWIWPYKHFRYKSRGTTVPFPFYANEWDAFDKLRMELFAPCTQISAATP
jgi:hypothetical protein